MKTFVAHLKHVLSVLIQSEINPFAEGQKKSIFFYFFMYVGSLSAKIQSFHFTIWWVAIWKLN